MPSSPRKFESIGHYHDYWGVVAFFESDYFPLPASEALDKAFRDLRSGFVWVKRKIKDVRLQRILEEMVEMSYEANARGDDKLASHVLQEARGIIWPSRATRLKHVVEAERRAFGEVVTYADVPASPFPYEGAAADLTSLEARLYAEGVARMQGMLTLKKIVGPIVVTVDAEGEYRQLKRLSRKKTKEELAALIASGDCVGIVQMTYMPGLLIVYLETPGRPNITIPSLVEDGVRQSARFHFDHPDLFQPSDTA